MLRWLKGQAERLNALPDPQDGEAFAAACEAVNADRTVSCVILTGAGRAFSAGGDLTAMRDRRDLFGGDQILEMTAAMQALAHLTEDHAKGCQCGAGEAGGGV